MKKGLKLGLVLGTMLILTTMMFAGTVSSCLLDTEILAGQTMNAGNVHIEHRHSVDRYMEITYTTSGGWKLTETHLAVATSLGDIPTNKKGNPIPGHFPYSEDHDPAVTTYTYWIDLDDFPGLYDPVTKKYLGTLYIAAHSVVVHPCLGEETGWADTDGVRFTENNWALYVIVELT